MQPIGENVFNIVVRSPHCRENSMTITLYREKQEIPLDLSSDISNVSNYDVMTIRATTIPGAVIHVLSPYTRSGHHQHRPRRNALPSKRCLTPSATIRSSSPRIIPGKTQTKLEYTVYYVPSVDIYSRKAWDIVTQYTDLMDNMSHAQIQQPDLCLHRGNQIHRNHQTAARVYGMHQRAAGTVTVYVENQTKTVWEVGKSYRLYGDAYGMYSQVPWLIVRYTYDP